MITEDTELLRRYAENGMQDAFTELVRRHVDLVYATALRRTNGQRTLAEDAAQRVFVALAGQANALKKHPTLSGWLFVTTRHAAATLMRSEQARRVREQEAHAMNESTAESPERWAELRPELDELIERLEPRDRDVLVRRYLQGQRFADIAAMHAVSEDAARMRGERALEKLRSSLSRRGITSTAAALTTALSSHAAVVAPGGLATAVAAAALATAPSAASAVAGASIFMSTAKMIVAAFGVLAVGAAGYFIGRHYVGLDAHPISVLISVHAPQQPSSATKASHDVDAVQRDAAPVALRTQAVDTPSASQRDTDAASNPWFRGMVPAGEWKNRGTTTPAAALETYLWAGDHIDLDARAAALGFGDLKKEVDEFYARLSPDVRAQYDSPEKLWAACMAAAPQASRITSFQLMSQDPNLILDAKTVTLRVRTTNEKGITYEGNMAFENSPTGWRRTLSPNLITPVFNLFPSAKAPPAPK